MQNFFALFDLEPSFTLDEGLLKKQFLNLQKAFHPDRFAQQNEAEKLKALQHSTLLNDAFQNLKNPITRAQHLLALENHPFSPNAPMPSDFLMRQMEWHEELEHSQNDESALENLLEKVERQWQKSLKNLEKNLKTKNFEESAYWVRALMFLEKIQNAVEESLNSTVNP